MKAGRQERREALLSSVVEQKGSAVLITGGECARSGGRRQWGGRLLWWWCLLWWCLCCWPVLGLAAADARLAPLPGHVAEVQCLSCHAEQAALHAGSQHAQAMLPATAASVRARFPSTYDGPGTQARFVRAGERFMVETAGPDGKPGRFVIAYTFGLEPLQQYLIELPGGRLQAFDLAWDTAAERWFWLGEGSQAPAAGAPLHWSGSFYRWNRNCADCHSTAVEKGFVPASGEYATRYAHVSVGCQACHGPGAEHVRWAQAVADGKAALADRQLTASKGFVAPAGMEGCLGCHSRRVVLADGFGAGRNYLDHYSPSLITPGLYFPDGQIQDEVFEYGSFLHSRMGQAGVSCLDCHQPHSGKLRLAGDASCLQCHAVGAQSRFGARAPQADFAAPAHVRHPGGSTGAACVACHMPTRTYMKVDARRDHGFSVPRPDLSLSYGVPNACTNCHQEQDAAWAAARMDEWYGRGWRQRPSTAPALAAAWAGRSGAEVALRNLLARRDLAGIVRASAVLAYAQLGGAQAQQVLSVAAADADGLVRLGAAEGAAQLPPAMRAAAIGDLLGDPLRAVRLASLRSLAALPVTSLSAQQRAQLGRAEEDLQRYLQANIDTAEAHELVGNVRFDQQRWSEAEAAFRIAIAVDPSYGDAYLNLAELLRLRADEAAALAVLDQGLAAIAGHAGLHYARALARIRGGALPAALADLAQARALEPASTSYAYAHALALDQLGQTAAAYDSLRTDPALDREDGQLRTLELQLALKLGRRAEARALARALLERDAGNQALRTLLQQLQNEE